MSLPEELITLAIVGTEKSGHPLPQVAEGLQTLLAQVDTVPERQMLLTIAGLDLRQRAGWMPPHADRLTIATAPTDAQSVIGRTALRHLNLMLKGVHKESLGEWLRAVAESGQRVPEEAIPELLELGKQNKPFRPAILALIGERGKWFAREVTTRDWVWFEPRNAERRWKQGSIETRLELLEFMLADDRAKVREMLAETWAKEQPKAKVAFIKLLADGLTLADEAFLENCLADERAEVRVEAATLLAQLNGSAYQQRALERLRPLIHKKAKLLGIGGGFTIDPPSAWEEAWERDGILRNEDLDMVLAQLVSCITPNQLCQFLQVDMATLFAWCTAPKQMKWFWANTLLKWLAYRSSDFNEWFLKNLPTKMDEQWFLALMHHNSPDVLAQEMPNFISRLTLRQVNLLLDRLPEKWDAHVSSTLINWLKTLIPENPVTYTANDIRALGDYMTVLANLVPHLAYRIPLDYGERLYQAIPRSEFYRGEDPAEICRVIVDFRREMLAAIHATVKE